MSELNVIINYVDFKNEDREREQKNAIDILLSNKPDNVTVYSINLETSSVEVPVGIKQMKTLKKDSSVICGNTRPLPYIREILDNASDLEGDIFGYINADIILSRDFFDIFQKQCDAYLFMREEIEDMTDFNKRDFRILKSPYPKFPAGKHPGYDGIFFNTKWWKDNGSKYHPDFILGEPCWDLYYEKKTKQLSSNVYIGRDLFHVMHKADWATKSSGMSHNTSLYRIAK